MAQFDVVESLDFLSNVADVLRGSGDFRHDNMERFCLSDGGIYEKNKIADISYCTHNSIYLYLGVVINEGNYKFCD